MNHNNIYVQRWNAARKWAQSVNSCLDDHPKYIATFRESEFKVGMRLTISDSQDLSECYIGLGDKWSMQMIYCADPECDDGAHDAIKDTLNRLNSTVRIWKEIGISVV